MERRLRLARCLRKRLQATGWNACMPAAFSRLVPSDKRRQKLRSHQRMVVESRRRETPSLRFLGRLILRARITNIEATNKDRSEERRVGKECVSTGKSRRSQYH